MIDPQIEHIAIKVDDVDQAANSFLRAGFTMVQRKSYPDIGIDLAELVLGNARFELLGAMHDNSPIAHDASGIHHVALRVGDLASVYEAAKSNPALEVVRPLGPGRRGTPVFFVRIRGTGALIEYVE